MRHSLSFLIVFIIGIIVTPNAFAETANVPAWIKNNAGWWASDQINDSSFLQGIQYLIKERIMVIPSAETASSSQSEQSVPAWVKNTAGWWADDLISETEFVNSLQYLIKVGIIVVPQAETTLKISGYPDWLINNPSWQTAREVTNSDFTNFDTSYVKEKVIESDGFLTLNGVKYKAGSNEKLNSYGFAGPEFSKIKPVNTYRIFAVGGSTTCCALLSFDEFWPAYLQEMFDDEKLGVNIEVINAGIVGNNSRGEHALIKDRLSLYQPDLIIMYDGWNDAESVYTRKISSSVGASYIDETIENWKSVCKMGNEKGFETIIMLQPVAGTGNRILPDHEFNIFDADTVETFRLYAESLVQLDQYCTATADFGGIFDYVQNSIFLDKGHVTSLGNQILAENVFAISLPIISADTGASYQTKTESAMYDYVSNSDQFVIYAAAADFSGKNFDGLDLRNAIFDRADLSNASLKDAKLTGVRFAFANLDGTSISGHDLTNSNLAGVNLSENDLTGTILKGANLSHTDLSGHNLSGNDLTGTVLIGADLSNTILDGIDLSEKDLTNAKLVGVDLSNKDLSKTILKGADLSYANLSGVNLSEKDLTNAKLVGVDLSNKDLSKTILKRADLSYANLSGVDLSGKDLTGTIFTGTNISELDLTRQDLTEVNLTGMNLDNVNLSGKNLTNAILIGVNLSYKDLTGTILNGADLSYANLSGVNLSGKDLTGTILKGAGLSNTNLSGVNLSGKDLTGTIFTGTDLTGTTLKEADLSQANLTGADLSSMDLTEITLKDADLSNADLSHSKLIDSQLSRSIFINTDIRYADFTGAYLQDVDFTVIKDKNWDGTIFFDTTFSYSNLEGMDFSGHDLTFTWFTESKLKGADFSNDVNIQGSFFGSADLTNANFEGVTLAPKKMYTLLFEDMAYLVRGSCSNINTQADCKPVNGYILGADLTGYPTVFVDKFEVRGNDLFAEYFLVDIFLKANLTGANFANSNLQYVNFEDVILSNADLSGANLNGANLIGANLSGAILDGASLDCKNHAICN
jgi:uncharacterized protein YjbI with pentapeptide repeats